MVERSPSQGRTARERHRTALIWGGAGERRHRDAILPSVGQHQHAAHVERDAQKMQLHGVTHEAAIAHTGIAVAALHQPGARSCR